MAEGSARPDTRYAHVGVHAATDAAAGELRYGICAADGHIVLDFGEAVRWVALTPADARELAADLIALAAQAERP